MKALKLVAGICIVIVLASVAMLSAGRSDVADAVMKGNKTALRTLLDQRADVNAPQADGSTALHWAAYRQDMEAASLLIRAGANAKAATLDGATPRTLDVTEGAVWFNLPSSPSHAGVPSVWHARFRTLNQGQR